MRKLLSFLIACCLGVAVNAQIVQVYHTNVGTALNGNDIYHVYADLQDADDFLSSVYAAGNDNLLLGGADGLIQNDAANGVVTGDALPVGFCGFVASLQDDSFVTIGWADDAGYYDWSAPCAGDNTPIPSGAGVTAIATLPSFTVIDDAFTNDPAVNLSMVDGAWFSTNGGIGFNANGLGFGPNNTVLIAQIQATAGVDLVYNLNIQIFDGSDGGLPILYVWNALTVDPVGPGQPTADTDGSCLGLQYPADPGCFGVDGCTDPLACNFDPLATNDDGSCTYPGCNDPLACNFDAAAGCDDGSCCFDNCVTMTVGGDAFDSEITWEIEDAGGLVVASGAAPDVQDLCLPDGCYTINMFDSFGDGWGTATWSLDQTGGGANYGTGTLASGSSGTAAAGIPDICGCTDPLACNFNSLAVVDDGSCIFPAANEDCANAIDITGNINGAAVTGDNTCASVDVNPSCGGISSSASVWYSFVYSGGDVTVQTILNGTLNDSRLAIYDACGGTELACNDDDIGLESLITIGCPTLTAGNTYWVFVGGFSNTNEGSFDLQISQADVLGCTDPGASNYDPCANVDDGGCSYLGCTDPLACNFCAGCNTDDGSCCLDNCVTVTVGGGSFDSEIDWVLQDAGGVSVASGFAPDSQDLCLPDGCYTMVMNDSFGDGWNGATWSVDETGGGANYGSGTLDFGLFTGSIGFAINATVGCTDIGACNYDSLALCDDGSCEYLSCAGCTDPLACNYDPAATVDDGSCVVCAPAACVVIDMFDSFGDGWGTATYNIVDASTGLSVASGSLADGFSGQDVVCLADGCYTYTVGGDTFDSEISYTITGGDAGPLSGGAPDSGSFSINTANCFGCTDPLACNYNSLAMYDDGSCASDNDEPGCTIPVSVSALGVCNAIAGNLTGATPSAASAFAGMDRWHSFVATSPGVSIEVSTTDFDAQLTLLDGLLNLVDTEDAVAGVGGETLNIGGLVEGNTYILSVGAAAGIVTGEYGICVQAIPDTRCDYGSGPYSMCDIFKADWVGGINYIFNFTAVSDGSVYVYATNAAWDYVQFFNVAGLTWDDDYDVLIDVVHEVANAAGTLEQITIFGNEPCTITIGAPPVSNVKASLNCANYGPHWLGDYISSTPWICGAVDWEWQFTRTDIAELPVSVNSNSFFNYLQLSSVPGIVEGATYDVVVRAILPNGSTSAYGTPECISIIGPAAEPSTGAPVVEGDIAEEKSDDFAGPQAAIYPNPNAGDFINLNLSGVETATVAVDIYDMFGKLVQAEQITVASGTVNTILNLNNLASGVYNVNITMGNTVQTERLVIQK